MIMPANYSVIAENELSYVDGGALAPLMTADQWKAVSSNLFTVVGNTAVQNVVNVVVGTFFSPAYALGNGAKAIADMLTPTDAVSKWGDMTAKPGSAKDFFGKNVPAAVVLGGRTGARLVTAAAGIYVLGAKTSPINTPSRLPAAPVL